MDKENLICPVCQGRCALLDVVDLNKSCEEPGGVHLPLSGIPVYYAICENCGFCFAPEMYTWPLEMFEERIYNEQYELVDPGYLVSRPKMVSDLLLSLFGKLSPAVRHLDYGGGNGLLANELRKSGWNSVSYDPFVDKNIQPQELGKFELITAIEVFEHVPDVQKLMSELNSLVSEEGFVLFSTQFSDGKIKAGERINWWYASPRNGHISLFSRKSLILLGEKHGFRFASADDALVFFKRVPSWASSIFRTIFRVG